MRHVDYGVTEERYAFFKRALLKTFADLLGPDFGPEAHDAWSQTYDELAGHMILAARNTSAPAPQARRQEIQTGKGDHTVPAQST